MFPSTHFDVVSGDSSGWRIGRGERARNHKVTVRALVRVIGCYDALVSSVDPGGGSQRLAEAMSIKLHVW